MNKITVKNIEINITGIGDDDYISLTDLARMLNKDDPRYPIQNWMRLKDTIEYIGLWEILNNENFNRVEFDAFKNEAGKNSFVMTPTKWINRTNAKGFKTKSGKYVCSICGYVYDPAVGDVARGIAPGTAFEDLSEDWTCPRCKQPKTRFNPA